MLHDSVLYKSTIHIDIDMIAVSIRSLLLLLLLVCMSWTTICQPGNSIFICRA